MNIISRRIRGFSEYAHLVGLRQAALLYAGRIARTGELSLFWDDLSAPISCRPGESDFYVLRHVFIDRDGDPPLAVRPRLIIDGGANVGYASVLYANKYPEAQIIAVEPDTANCDRIRRNCATLPNVHLIQGGIWSHHTHLQIRNPDAEPWAFEVVETNEAGPGTVEGFTIDELLDKAGETIIDIVKLDIEGSEIQVFSEPHIDWVDRTRVLSVEVHGPEAERVVLAAFANRDFSVEQKGEKLIFTNNRLAAAPVDSYALVG